MSESKHTTGKLIAEGDKLFADGGLACLAICCGGIEGSPEANAKRLAAAWNAVEWLDTQSVEALPACQIPPDLLAACNGVETALDEYADWLAEKDLSSSAANLVMHRNILRAAIQKAKGA